MSTDIFLARHGKTLANLENRFAGRTEEPLHQLGREQYRVMAEKLKGEGIKAIYAGPLTRARQSAEIISQATGAGIEISEAFNEIDLPHWDGLTKDEITERFGPEYPTWLSAPQNFKVAGCETLSRVQERAVEEIEHIFANHQGEKVLVVSHLIVVRCLILHYQQQPISGFRSIKIDNASLTLLSRHTDGQNSVSL